LIKEYGALICVTVTTCRKAVTIILSFTLFSKLFVFEYENQNQNKTSIEFIFSYILSALIVVVGIYLNVYSRNQTAFNNIISSWYQKIFSSKKTREYLLPV